MVWFPCWLLAASVAAAPMEVHSSVDCPSSAAVLWKLVPLLPEAPAQDSRGRTVWIEPILPAPQDAVGLHVRLLRADATVVGDRRLAVQGSCEDMAETIATVVAAWDSPSTATAVVPAPSTSASLSDATLGAPSSAYRLETGVGAGAILVDGGAAVAGFHLAFGRASSHWQARLVAALQSSRERALDRGQVGWWRAGASLGLGWRSLGQTWRFSTDVGPMLGWVTVTGQGFSPDARQGALDYGAGAGVRVERGFGLWTVWLEWRAARWMATQRAVLWGSPAALEIPSFDLMAQLGASRSVLH